MAEYLPPEVRGVMGVVDTYLRWSNVNQSPRGHEHYHPSAFGNCLRQMQYLRYQERGWVQGSKDNPEPFMIRVWGNGHSMHDRWRSYFEALGILKGVWVCTNPTCGFCDDNGIVEQTLNLNSLISDPGLWMKKRRVYGKDVLQGVFRPDKCICGWNRFRYDEISVIDKELNFYGHADIILDFSRFDPGVFDGFKLAFDLKDLPTGNVVVDMKSINHFDFQDVAKGNAHAYYEIQLNIYANVLKCDYGILIYENKNNQRTAAFRIDKSEDTIWPDIQRQAILMNEMVDVTDDDGNVHHLLPPPRPSLKESKDCNYCLFKTQCHDSSIWDDPELQKKRLEFYGKTL